MLILHAKFRIKSENTEEMLSLAKGMLEPSNNEEGCMSYEFFQDPYAKNYFIFVETWRSREDLDLHFEMPYFKEFDDRVTRIVEENPSVITYEIENISKIQ